MLSTTHQQFISYGLNYEDQSSKIIHVEYELNSDLQLKCFIGCIFTSPVMNAVNLNS